MNDNYIHTTIQTPKSADWECYLFGNTPGGIGMVYRPSIGNVPNWFIRWMMRICLGCTWVRDPAVKAPKAPK